MRQESWLEVHGSGILAYGAAISGLLAGSMLREMADSIPLLADHPDLRFVLGFGVGAIVGLFVLAAIVGVADDIAEKYSPWRARHREREREEINEQVARSLFGWHPGTRCDGEVAFDGYCEKCHQEDVVLESPGQPDHPIAPLNFCSSPDAALHVIEKLFELKARVRVESNTDPNTHSLTEPFRCIIKSSLTEVIVHQWGRSVPETIARAAAEFSSREAAWVKAYVDHLRGTWLGELRKLMSDVKALAEDEKPLPAYALDAEDFVRSVRHFAKRLLEEEGEGSLRKRLGQLESSVASFRTELETEPSRGLSNTIIKAYGDLEDLRGSIGRELLLLKDSIENAPLDVTAGFPAQISLHSKWRTSPEYLDQPPSLSTLLEAKGRKRE